MRPLANTDWFRTDAETLAQHGHGSARALRESHLGAHAPRADRRAAPALEAVLTRTITHEVIPRLVRARQATSPPTSALGRPIALHPTRQQMGQQMGQQVVRLARIALAESQSATDVYLETLRAAGTPVDRLLLELVAPAAQHLGALWDNDQCDFTGVTLGTLRLNQSVRRLGAVFAGAAEISPRARRALLAHMPGEQHGLGLSMLVQFFRRAGWQVRAAPCPNSAELIGLVRDAPYEMIGLSLSCDSELESLAGHIRAIRTESANRAIAIMVGGPPFIAHPQLASMVGADATALDARAAVHQADRLVRLRTASR